METQWRKVWNRGNDAGDGYPIGEVEDSPIDAATREGWTVLEHGTDGMVLARDLIGRPVAIGDAGGPWAVTIASK